MARPRLRGAGFLCPVDSPSGPGQGSPHHEPATTPMSAKSTIFGGTKVLAVHRTGSGQAASNILVRQLPLRLLPDLLDSMFESNDAKLIALYTGNEPEWSDTLSDDSIEEILRIGEELNNPPLAGWLGRKDARLARLVELTSAKPATPTPGKSGE